MGQARNRIHALSPAAGSDEPTVGAIKRALHELSRTTPDSAQNDNGAVLREAHDQLRQLARRNGIDPDDAVRRRLAEVESLRARMALASATASDQTSC